MSQTQQFDGKSIEAALAAAADTLGPNVQVAEARKVRKGGVLGFFAQERYEIEAFASETHLAPAKPRSVEAAFDALLAEVEAAEAPAPPPSAAPSWVHSLSDFLSEQDQPKREQPTPAQPTPGESHAFDEPAAAPAPSLDNEPLVGRHFAKPGAHPTAVSRGVSSAATTLISQGQEPRVRRARLAGGEPDWSCLALFELGVPRALCEHIAEASPTTDLEWMNALEAAIEALTPPTARSTDLLCTLGQGRTAAIAMLRAGVAGVAPGILYIDGAEVVATPTELALAVRACLPR